MKAITLRNIPKLIADHIQAEAGRNGASLNKTVIDLIAQTVPSGAEQRRRRYHDLDRLAGTWSRDEYEQFSSILDEQRSIDPELWKLRASCSTQDEHFANVAQVIVKRVR